MAPIVNRRQHDVDVDADGEVDADGDAEVEDAYPLEGIDGR